MAPRPLPRLKMEDPNLVRQSVSVFNRLILLLSAKDNDVRLPHHTSKQPLPIWHLVAPQLPPADLGVNVAHKDSVQIFGQLHALIPAKHDNLAPD